MANNNEIRDFKMEEFVTVPEDKIMALAQQLLDFMEKSKCGNLSYMLYEDNNDDEHKAIWYYGDSFTFQMSYSTTELDKPISDSEARDHLVAMLKDLVRGYNLDIHLVDEAENDIVRWNGETFNVCTYFLNPDPKPCEECQVEQEQGMMEVKQGIITLRFPITRYGEIESSVTLDLSKEEDMIKFSDPMHVYRDYLTEDERDRILEGYHKGEVDDVFNYIRDNLITHSGLVLRFQLMGDRHFYEGLTTQSEGVYYINLGS